MTVPAERLQTHELKGVEAPCPECKRQLVGTEYRGEAIVYCPECEKGFFLSDKRITMKKKPRKKRGD